MTYPNQTEIFEKNKQLIRQLSDLEPGESVTVTCKSKQQANRIRHVVYGWLKTNQIKQFYRVYWSQPTEVKVLKLETDIELVTQKDKLSQKLQNIFAEMIQNETDPLTIPMKYKNEGIITAEEVGQLICEFQEFMK